MTLHYVMIITMYHRWHSPTGLRYLKIDGTVKFDAANGVQRML